MTMIHRISETKKTADLDDLTEDRRADIDRLLKILWKTNPVVCSVKREIIEERQYVDEGEESICFHYLQASGL
jgi:hypothetical protein